MYESQTYETILARMLERVPDDLDKRQGSVIFDAVAPAAWELAEVYRSLDNMQAECYGDTASREYLLRLCDQSPVTPYPATAAVVRIETTPAAVEVPTGHRFSGANANYVILSKIEDGAYRAQCETAGSIGNATGQVLPIDYLQGLETAAITEIIVYGEDDEDTEHLRERYLASLKDKPFAGNAAAYKETTLAVAGIGAVRTYRAWGEGGRVMLVILNSEYGLASAELIQTVQNLFDPTGTGEGDGLAPIGHKVQVSTTEEIDVNVTCTLTYKDGYTWDLLKDQIKAAVDGYLAEFREAWGNDDKYSHDHSETHTDFVRIAQVEAHILAVEGVADITATKINRSAHNLEYDNFYIPVVGTVNGY